MNGNSSILDRSKYAENISLILEENFAHSNNETYQTSGAGGQIKSSALKHDLFQETLQHRDLLNVSSLVDPHHNQNVKKIGIDPNIYCGDIHKKFLAEIGLNKSIDREKQKIMDLESSIEFLMQNNSRLTIQNTTLKYKFEVLKAHIEKARENKFQPFASKRQAFDDSTQIREDGLDNTQQSLRIVESSMDRTMDTTAEVGFNQYSRDRIGFNDHSEICAVVDATEKPENKKTGEVEPTSFNYEWQNSGEGDKRCNVGKKRNHKNLSLLIRGF